MLSAACVGCHVVVTGVLFVMCCMLRVLDVRLSVHVCCYVACIGCKVVGSHVLDVMFLVHVCCMLLVLDVELLVLMLYAVCVECHIVGTRVLFVVCCRLLVLDVELLVFTCCMSCVDVTLLSCLSVFHRKGKKPIVILRTQLSVRVHYILGNPLLFPSSHFLPLLTRGKLFLLSYLLSMLLSFQETHHFLSR